MWSLRISSILVLLLTGVASFQVQPALDTFRAPSRALFAVELEAEPAGGEELTPFTSLPGCRMKQMEELTAVDTKLGTPYQFWMEAEVDGTLIKQIRTQIMKDASKQANFPGFRKGQVPPYAQPQITQFAVKESIIKTVQAALNAFGLKELEGSNGEVEVKEDVAAMAKGYKTGDALQFTATVNGAFDAAKAVKPADEATEEVATATEE